MHSVAEPEAWKIGASAINRFYRAFGAWFSNKQTPINGFLEPTTEEAVADKPEFSLDSLHKTAMIGTPEEVIKRLRHYEQLGVTEYSIWSDSSLSFEEKKRSLELFIAEVAPAFQ